MQSGGIWGLTDLASRSKEHTSQKRGSQMRKTMNIQAREWVGGQQVQTLSSQVRRESL